MVEKAGAATTTKTCLLRSRQQKAKSKLSKKAQKVLGPQKQNDSTKPHGEEKIPLQNPPASAATTLTSTKVIVATKKQQHAERSQGTSASGQARVAGSNAAPQQSGKKTANKCQCSRSKCLKLYCECFAQGGHCGPDCGCTDCFNRPEMESYIASARAEITKRDPKAFAKKL